MKTRWFLVCATILGATVLLRADVTVPKSTEPRHRGAFSGASRR